MTKKNKNKSKSKSTVFDAVNVFGNIISYVPKGLYKLSELILNGFLTVTITIVDYFSETNNKLLDQKDNENNKKNDNKSNNLDENKRQNLDIELKNDGSKLVDSKLKHKKDFSVESKYEQFTILKKDKGTFDEFEDFVYHKSSTIGIILGKRGSGKSAIGIKFLENLHSKTRKKCYALGFDDKSLPNFIEGIDEINDIEDNSFVLIDEGGILFSSRASMSKPNKILSDLILIARHKDLSILFISQNSSNLDVNIIRQADYLVLKPASLLQNDFERKIIRDIYEKLESGFKKYYDEDGLTYIYSDIFRGFVKNSLPSFWSMNLSKSFKNFGKQNG